MNILVQLAWVLAVLAYGVIYVRFVPKQYQTLINLLASLIFVLVAIASGYSVSQLGLSVSKIIDGLIIGLVASLPIIIILWLGVRNNNLRPYFRTQAGNASTRVDSFLFDSTVRVPFSTALSEEIIFRGVLLAVILSYHGWLSSLLITGLVFGFWHIMPTLHNKNHLTRSLTTGLVLNVSFTALAGVGLGILRLVSGSVVAAWIVHSATNSAGLILQHDLTTRNI